MKHCVCVLLIATLFLCAVSGASWYDCLPAESRRKRRSSGSGGDGSVRLKTRGRFGPRSRACTSYWTRSWRAGGCWKKLRTKLNLAGFSWRKHVSHQYKSPALAFDCSWVYFSVFVQSLYKVLIYLKSCWNSEIGDGNAPGTGVQGSYTCHYWSL